MPHRRARLGLEQLEDRSTPAVFGNPWPDPGHLTISFAPDGTDVAGQASVLQQALGARMTTAQWQGEILRAFQTWAVQTNVDFSVVADNGTPLGTPGPVQGSPYFGDIRIVARPLSSNALIVSTPFDLVSGWAGEIVVNSNKLFDNDGSVGTYDLYTAMLQEAGHVLGIGNSVDPASVMYEFYRGPRTGLSSSDIASVQALYGARQDDRFEGVSGDGTTTTAANLTFVQSVDQLAGKDGSDGAKPSVAVADLTHAGDVDVYRFTTGVSSTDFFVALKTTGVSLLQAKVTLLDSFGRVVGPATTEIKDGSLNVFYKNMRPGSIYYVKVEAAKSGPFGVGAYRLAVGNEALAAVNLTFPDQFVTPTKTFQSKDDATKPSNETLAQATNLGMALAATDARWDYTGHAAISAPGEVDYYQVRTRAETPPVLLVTVWATEVGKFDPLATIYDSTGKALAAQVLRNDGHVYTLQVTGIAANQDYFVRVAATDPANVSQQGGYFLGIDFRNDPIVLTPLASSTLSGAQTQNVGTLEVTRSQWFLFQLSAQSTQTAAVRMTIYNAAGKAVFTLSAKAGETLSGEVLLGPGTYTVRFVAGTQDGSPLQNLAYTASFLATSDPIGPELITDPIASPTSPSGTSTSSGYTWYFLTSYNSWLTLKDPYSTAWW